jgi:hypothetical protein
VRIESRDRKEYRGASAQQVHSSRPFSPLLVICSHAHVASDPPPSPRQPRRQCSSRTAPWRAPWPKMHAHHARRSSRNPRPTCISSLPPLLCFPRFFFSVPRNLPLAPRPLPRHPARVQMAGWVLSSASSSTNRHGVSADERCEREGFR